MALGPVRAEQPCVLYLWVACGFTNAPSTSSAQANKDEIKARIAQIKKELAETDSGENALVQETWAGVPGAAVHWPGWQPILQVQGKCCDTSMLTLRSQLSSSAPQCMTPRS